MAEILTKGRELYGALSAGDVEALRQLLSVNFQGQLSEGLPYGIGRHYDGLESMMADGWGAVGKWFEMSPDLKQLFNCDDILIGRGEYIGIAKPTRRRVRAAFAHFWSFNGRQFTAVTQVTDSGMWRDALTNEFSCG